MASVNYKINGKYNGKAVNQAQKGLKQLGSAAKKFNLAVAGFVVSKVFSGINKVVKGSTEAFLAQNTALVKYQKSLASTGVSLENMNQLKNELSRNNFFDDDSLNNAIMLANQMGLTEEQITKVVSASTDLAASGVMPLDQAVKKLAETYSGTTGELAKMAPELKNLTKEQLKNGGAVDVIQKKYAGFADTMSNTFSGRDTQFKNIFSDLQAEVGSVIQSIKYMLEGLAMGPLQKLTNWLSEHRDKILAFIVSLPDICKVVFDAIKKMFDRLFSTEGFKAYLKYIGEAICAWIKGIGKLLLTYAQYIGESIWTCIEILIGNLKALTTNKIQPFIWNSIAKAFNKISDMFYNSWLYQKIVDFVELIDKAVSALNGGKGLNIDIGKMRQPNTQILKELAYDTVPYTSFADYQEQQNKKIDEVGSKMWEEITNASAEAKEKLVEYYKSDFQPIVDDATKHINDIIANAKIPGQIEETVKTEETAEETAEETGEKITENIKTTCEKVESVIPTFFEDVASTFGDLGSFIQNSLGLFTNISSVIKEGKDVKKALTENGLLTPDKENEIDNTVKSNITTYISNAGLSILSGLLNIIEQVSSESNAVAILLDFGSELISSVINDIIPVLDSVATIILQLFQPLSEMLSIVVNVIATTLNSLKPLIQIVVNIISIIVSSFSSVLSLFSTAIQIMGLLFEIVSPVLSILEVIIKPINLIAKVVAFTIGNVLVAIYNAVIWCYNGLMKIFNWGRDQKDYQEFYSADDLEADLTDIVSGNYYDKDYLNSLINAGTTTASSSTSGSASYTAARDIYVNIYYDNCYVNGDKREIALDLWNTIKEAEKLGY